MSVLNLGAPMSLSNYSDYQAYFEAIHAMVDDQVLDEYVTTAGLPSGIGRMCHLTDEILSSLVDELPIKPGQALLDLGSGRGFLARWFRWKRLDIRYYGIDFSPTAVKVARQAVPEATFTEGDFRKASLSSKFDRVFAIEVALNGYIDPELATSVLRPLAPTGVAAATLVSFKNDFHLAMEKSLSAIEAAGGTATVTDVTARVQPFAQAISMAVLADRTGPAELTERAHEECTTVLDAIRNRTYGYALFEIRHVG